MGGVVRPKTDGEYYQSAERQTYGAQPPPPSNVWKTRQDEDEVNVAEGADEERDAEENEEELQADRQQNFELVLCEIQVAGSWRGRAATAAVSVCTFVPLCIGYDVDNAEVRRGHHPEYDTGQHSVARPATQGVPEWVGNPQVTLHTHGCEEQRTVVDGDIEQKTSEGTQGEGQQPGHVVRGLLHFEWQEDQEDKVRDGEVEEEDVYWGCLAVHLATEGAECQDVGRDAHQEGEDVDTKQQVTVQHGDCSQ